MKRPFKIFGYEMTVCHVLPAMVMLVVLSIVTFAVFSVVSHNIPPVQLTAIWLEPNEFKASDVAAGRATFTLKKSGKWRRHCPIDARHTFIDEKGTIRFSGEMHAVDVPKTDDATTLRAKPRKEPDILPKILQAAPGVWKLRLVNLNGACWWWEKVWPIAPSVWVEAPFRIVEDR